MFHPVVFHSMSGTLISIFEGFFINILLSYDSFFFLLKHLMNLLTRG